MGLSIAKGIVEAHGGLIWIEYGAGGKGTQVSFTVPVGDDETGSHNDAWRWNVGEQWRVRNAYLLSMTSNT